MPTDAAHTGRAVSSATASNVRSPRTVLVHCAIARSENGTPVQGHVWLALQPRLRTPVLCLKPLNGPIAILFFQTFGTPERDASGCGWHLVLKQDQSALQNGRIQVGFDSALPGDFTDDRPAAGRRCRCHPRIHNPSPCKVGLSTSTGLA